MRSIRSEILLVNGDFSKYQRQNFDLPDFGALDFSLKTLIGGVQYGQITLDKYKYNPRTKKFSGQISVIMKDDFGVSAEDAHKARWIPESKGIRALWFLQHIRGFKPFLNIYQHKSNISF